VAKLLALIRYSIFVLYNSGLEVLIISLEYLQEIPNKKVFVCVKDERLKEAFNEHDDIIVVENYEEFKEQSISQFFDDYFIEKFYIKILCCGFVYIKYCMQWII
jgi:hypothetical protein